MAESKGARQRWTPAAWASSTYVAVSDRAASPMLAIGFAGFSFYVFAYFSGVLDLDIRIWRLHLPGIALAIAVAVAVLSGRIPQVLRNRIGLFMAGLSIWFVLSIPGAHWRGGSVEILTTVWIPRILLFVVGGSVITTVTQCRRSLWVFGLAIATGALIVAVRGDASRGRLLLAATRYANSNTIAIMLLLGMPMVWLMAAGPQVGKARKMLVGGLLVMMLATLLRTGSREGIIGLAVLCATAFVRSRGFGKVTIAFAVTALGLLSVFFLPQSVKSRLGTILEPEAVEVEEDQGTQWAVTTSAAASSQSRLRLLMDSLSVTASHPLLGVGPGNFAPYCAFKEQQKARPGFALWVGTHNTYTQVSSELGIPGLIFYLGILVASMRALHSFYRRGQRIPGNRARDIAYMALALHTSLVAFCVMCFFDHMAYEQAMPVIAAITVAMSLTVPDELKRLEEAARAADAAKGPNFPGASQGAARPGARVPGGRVPGARFEKSR